MSFNVFNIPLTGRHLIEASAGTGKTYSIANLVLRLLLEAHPGKHDTPLTIDQILVVTFTNAAADELRGRIRSKIEQALSHFRGIPVSDAFILEYKNNISDEEALGIAKERLYNALLCIDEAAIFTIHSFAVRVIRAFLFETGALAEVEVVIGKQERLQQQIDDLYRNIMMSNEYNLVPYLRRTGIDARKFLIDLHQYKSRYGIKILADSPSFPALVAEYEKNKKILLDERDVLKNQWHFVDIAAEDYPARREEMRDYLYAAFNGNITNQNLTNALKFIYQDFKALAGATKSKAAYISTIAEYSSANDLSGNALVFYSIFKNILAYNTLESAFNNALGRSLKCELSTMLDKAELRHDAAVMDPDDVVRLINNKLDDADGANRLIKVISSQYPVCMVDEFQDTDPNQFNMFDRLYKNVANSGLYAIGDPKQSIYSFRGADIFAYIDVKSGIENTNIHTLDTNFRSKKGVMDGVNALFKEPVSIDANTNSKPSFLYDGISYEQVYSCEDSHQAKKQNKGMLRIGEQDAAPFVFIGHVPENGETDTFNNIKPVYARDAAERIVALLQKEKNVRLIKDGGEKQLSPGDIAVLVRDFAEANEMLHALKARGVPAVYLSQKDSVIKQCEFAQDLLFVLKAMENPLDKRCLATMFATPMMRGQTTDFSVLNKFDSEDANDEEFVASQMEKFSELQKCWKEKGILPALQLWLTNFSMHNKFFARDNGPRLMTDFRHIGELLQQEYMSSGSMERLIEWYQTQLNDDSQLDADAKTMRLESDKNLVKILTLHGCKGLEYPVVFMPFFFNPKLVDVAKKVPFYHINEGAWQGVVDIKSEEKDINVFVQKEQMAEDMRLLYVGITRAIYQCYIGISSAKNNKTFLFEHSPWSHLLDISHADPSWHDIKQAVQKKMQEGCADAGGEMYCVFDTTDSTNKETVLHIDNVSNVLFPAEKPVYPVSNWKITSYTGLTHSKDTRVIQKEMDEVEVAIEPSLETEMDSVVAADVPDNQLADEAFAEDIRCRFPRGKNPGIALHAIFEHVANSVDDKNDNAQWQCRVARELEKNSVFMVPAALKSNPEKFHEENDRQVADIVEWINAVLDAPLDRARNIPSLRDIFQGFVFPEMDFHFGIGEDDAEASLKVINHVFTHECKTCNSIPVLPGRSKLNGIMKGSMDLFFIHDKKCYILDYKSNFLGDAPASYRYEKMSEAIISSQYDLQYLIYSVAGHRFMKQRLANRYDFDAGEYSFGGVIYLFVRGMAVPGYPDDYGIWFHRPEGEHVEALDKAFSGKKELHDE